MVWSRARASALFPYATLFRSPRLRQCERVHVAVLVRAEQDVAERVDQPPGGVADPRRGVEVELAVGHGDVEFEIERASCRDRGWVSGGAGGGGGGGGVWQGAE